MRKYPRNVLIATLASLLTDISSEMVVYLLPLFLSAVLNTPVTFIGLIEGVAETTSSLSKLFSGYFSDQLRTRKWFTVVGYGLSTLAKISLAIAGSWQAVFGARFADRLGILRWNDGRLGHRDDSPSLPPRPFRAA